MDIADDGVFAGFWQPAKMPKPANRIPIDNKFEICAKKRSNFMRSQSGMSSRNFNLPLSRLWTSTSERGPDKTLVAQSGTLLFRRMEFGWTVELLIGRIHSPRNFQSSAAPTAGWGINSLLTD